MKKSVVVLSFLVAAAASACSGGQPPAQPAATAGAPKPASSAVNVDIKDFKHQDVAVRVGAAVTWTNQDNTRHTTTATGGKWKSEAISNGQSFSFTFNEPGTFDYVCEIHSTMKAKVTVS